MRCNGALVLAAFLGLVASSRPALAADDEALARRKEFFYSLVPGVTVQEMVAAVGKPDTESLESRTYRVTHGTVTVHASGGLLTSIFVHDDSGVCQGCLGTTLYYAPSPLPREETKRTFAGLEELIAKRAFAGGVDLLGPGYRTARHPEAICYLLGDGYLAVEEVAPRSSAAGAFQHAVARATVFRRPALEPEVVWRLADHWREARPSGLGDAELDRREAVLRQGAALAARNPRTGDGLRITALDDVAPREPSIAERLGPPDGTWGSGLLYGLYYIRDGLLTVVLIKGSTGWPRLSQPGAEHQTTFEEWLQK